jgi:hypothetical protein
MPLSNLLDLPADRQTEEADRQNTSARKIAFATSFVAHIYLGATCCLAQAPDVAVSAGELTGVPTLSPASKKTIKNAGWGA